MSTTITGIEREPFEYFDLAFLGYNYKTTKDGFGLFLRNHAEQILRADMLSLTAVFKDGTRIRGLYNADYRNLAGYKFDQLILFDDERWLIEWDRAEDIRIIKALTMQLSNVPKEFQILKYEDIR